MTTPKPCTVKGCKAKYNHHHDQIGCAWACPEDGSCTDSILGPAVAPRRTRKTLLAENGQLVERGWADAKVIADLTAKVREFERAFAELKAADEKPRTLGDLTAHALSVSLAAGDAEASVRLASVLANLHSEGLTGWTATP